MNYILKIKAFEYWLNKTLNWADDLDPKVQRSSFTRLKVLKLLFFTSAIKNEEGQNLLDVFDNFHALPNGPVESDIYNFITEDRLMFYTFKDFSFAEKRKYEDIGMSDELKQRIDKAITMLRKKNQMIVSYNAEKLVSLSHTWLSWQNAIMIAKALGKGSYKMDVNLIENNPQYFGL